MQIIQLRIDGVVELIPKRLGDSRGYFVESYSQRRMQEFGLNETWVQDNQSLSAEQHVLRGLHFQIAPFAQIKLVRVLRGSIFDVAVDLRKTSPTFGQSVSCVLTAEKGNQLLVPIGFAHGFLTLEPATEVFYKVSAPYSARCDRCLLFDDPALGVDWPLGGKAPVLSEKDRNAPKLADIIDQLNF